MLLGRITLAACLPSIAAAFPGGAAALDSVQSATNSLDRGLQNWNGFPLGIISVGFQAQRLLTDIGSTATTLQRLGNRTGNDDKQIMTSAQKALDSLDHIIDTVVNSKTKFTKLPLGTAVIFGVLKTLEVATNKMVQNGVDGASPGYRKQMEKMQDHAKGDFTRAFSAIG
ncbi:hydrophobic surface binding protein A domain-containing protein [Hirsutella rhossiliensis]|uniref:Hydrophobic surface binding protein A domain-containing protein n=1 Tax=Hirsutella rhossiliensis TaxID=111463 RepID=A0A9P8MU53_9HYPO|nr:hydrophobic surface binding protein A domain-containing protein [Hirsutella rhossiliensis]KAH0961117.1 hydrophobic surface binding protein A domain-containing protein [Hirsutella rhossiliensis]